MLYLLNIWRRPQTMGFGVVGSNLTIHLQQKLTTFPNVELEKNALPGISPVNGTALKSFYGSPPNFSRTKSPVAKPAPGRTS